MGGIIFVLSLSYPFIVYFLGKQIPASYIILGLVSVLFMRSAVQYRQQGASNVYMTLAIVTLMTGLFLWKGSMAVMLYPIIMSLSFAFLLGWSLIYPPSLIERIARIIDPNLDSYGVDYTRKVTMFWLGFSLFNALISFSTVLLKDPNIWLLYNGFISYIVIGSLMGVEYFFRGYYKNKYAHKSTFTPVQQLLALRDDDFWKKYWNSPDTTFYSHYIHSMTQRIKKSNAKRMFLISEDRAHFLAGFLAGLYAGVPVVIPQSDAPEFLTDLMEPGDVLLTDRHELKKAIPALIEMSEIYETKAPLIFAPLDPELATVIFYTSGSTGKPKAVEKKLRQLEAEIEVLHNLWGQREGGRFLSTVSHHHLYAFLYSLLWPVCGGFDVERYTFTYWGDLLGKSSAGDFLISSPAHLGRFLILKECEPVAFRYAFSSGAPLSYEAATESKKYLGVLPIEVYGSTETGGIGFRQQEQPSTPWRRFDCVKLFESDDNKLRVESPYIDGDGFFQTEDQITWIDADVFQLLGRADRIVKVEGKRVSLTEIENKLSKTGLVSEAAVLVLEKSYREELGAVIVLSDAGADKLKAVGKMTLKRCLREALAAYFHPVVIPRKWRFIDAIPVNAQGKRQQSALKDLFAANDKSSLGPILQPVIVQKEISQNRVEYCLKIPQDLAYFEGHFNTMPVVPGVVQLKWAVDLARADLGLKGDVSQGSQIKFMKLMRPNDLVSLLLEFNADTSTVSYRYKAGDASYSSGRMTFSAGAPNGL